LRRLKEVEEKIVKALKKAFADGLELIKYDCGVYANSDYCDHTDVITNIEQLLQVYGED
jgi:hypothetical protein